MAEVDARKAYIIEFIYAEEIKDDRIFLLDKESKIAKASFKRKNMLYCLDKEFIVTNHVFTVRDILNKSKFNNNQIDRMMRVHELHKRMGYLSLSNLSEALKHNSIAGKFSEGEINEQDVMNYKIHLHPKICNGCNLAKMNSQSSAAIDHHSIPNNPGTLHADIMHISHDLGTLHYYIGIDEQSAMTFGVQIPSSDNKEMQKAVKMIKNSYKRHKHTLDVIHFDNETGMNCFATNAALHEAGIDTDNHTPGRHVRRAELAIKLVKRTFKAVLNGLDYPCPIKLYPYVIRWSIQCINLTGKEGNKIVAPWTIFTGRRIAFDQQFAAKFGDIIITRTFAEDARRPKSNKPICTFGIILCRDDNMRGTYQIMDLATKRIIKRRQFKHYHGSKNATILKRIASIGKASSNTIFGHVEEDLDFSNIEYDENLEDIQQDDDDITEDEELGAGSNDSESGIDDDSESGIDDVSESSSDNDNDDDDIQSIDENVIQATLQRLEAIPIAEPKQANKRQWKPTRRMLESSIYFTATTDNMSIKSSIAKHGSKATNEAVQAELKNMTDRQVWVDAEPHEAKNKNVVPSKMILKAKHDANGKFIKFKGRLVARGDREELPDEFRPYQVESPTASYNNILLMLHLAIIYKKRIAITDVTAAYLNADIQGEVYMRLPKDVSLIYSEGKTEQALVRLRKCIYGLKQSGRRWYELICDTLTSLGYMKCNYEACAFINGSSWIIIYVDDFIILSDSKANEDNIIARLEANFGSLQVQQGPDYSFLGLSLTRSETMLTINQSGYVEKITKEIETTTTATKYPHRAGFKAYDNNNNSSEEVDEATKSNFRSLIMKLMYLGTHTRPDIIYNTAVLATKNNPSTTHFKDVNKIFEYLKSNRNLGIAYSTDEISMVIYVDAAFQVHNDRKSHSGYSIHLNSSSGPILYKSQKQKALAQSSTEAELIALFDATRHLLQILGLLDELKIPVKRPITVYEDNRAVIEILQSDKILRGNAKFIDRKYLTIREIIKSGDIKLVYIATDKQVADFLTKSLTGSRFISLLCVLLGVILYQFHQ